ncbi:site-specific integrase [Listeria monocytogenes]|nr:site-specific integrase [Listeria monocytogenes]
MSIKKIGNQNYRIIVSLGFDPLTGKQRRKQLSNIKTKAEAERIYAEIKNRYRTNNLPSSNKISFRELTTIYFNEYTFNQKPTYIRAQVGYSKNHLLPFFSETDISKISLGEIKAFQNTLLEKSQLSNNSINKHLILLKKIFDVAVEKQYISNNPCVNLKKLKVEKEKMKFWDLDTFKLFIEGVESDYKENKHAHPEKFVFVTFYYNQYLTGLRAGEATALLWSDNDFTKNEFDINKTASRIKGEYIITSPKSKSSIRRVTYNEKFKHILKKWQKIQKEILADYGIEVNEKTHIFQYSDKIPDRDNFSTKKINRICSNINLSPIRLHDFRHSHVALLINNKEEITSIKERMGHASIITTIDTYGHLFPNKQQSMSDNIDNLF